VRVLALAECGTHAIIDAALGPYATGELSLALNCPGFDGGLGGWTYATSLDCGCSR
jgi:hypothetical protein